MSGVDDVNDVETFQTVSWNCRIPVCLTLAPHEISSPTSLPPIYVLAPRNGFLHALAVQAWPHVQHVLPSAPGQTRPRPWMDFRGVALKGHLPTGVLFDLLADDASISEMQQSSHGSTDTTVTPQLPWELTLHYTNPPDDTSSSWLNRQPPQSQYMQSLKEACHICRGTEGSGAVMRMSGQAQDALWGAIEAGELRGLRATLATLRVVPASRQGAPPALPVRVLVRTAGDDAGGRMVSWDSVASTSRPVPAQHVSGSWVTLGEALGALLPALFPAQAAAASTAAAAAAAVTGQTSAESGSAPSAGAGAGGARVSGCGEPGAGQAGSQAVAGTAAGQDDAPQPQSSGSPMPADHNPVHSAAGNEEQLSPPAASVPPSQSPDQPLPGEAAGSQEDAAPGAQDGPGAGEAARPAEPPQAAASDLCASGVASVAQPVASGTGAASAEGPAELAASTASLAGGPASGARPPASHKPARLSMPLALPPGCAVRSNTSAGGAEDRQDGDGSGPHSGSRQGTSEAGPLVLIAGTQPPLETPLAWLHARLHAPDYFLYIVVRCR